MTNGGSTIDAPPAAGEAAARLCPGCGYDLRAATTDRCSECGLLLDRAALQESGFPWAHRKRIGRVRAFVTTVWRVTQDSRSLRHETAKPQGLRDAARFRRWNAAAVALALSGFAGTVVASGAARRLAGELHDAFTGGRATYPAWAQDLAVPWAAGLTLLPALPVYLVAMAVHLTGAQRAVFRLARYPDAYRDRAAAIANYAAAPMAWLLPAAAIAVATHSFRNLYFWKAGPKLGLIDAVAMAVGPAMILIAILSTLFRSGQWAARSRHGSLGAGARAAAELLGRWAVGVVVFLGLVPWCVGFLWVAIDAAR